MKQIGVHRTSARLRVTGHCLSPKFLYLGGDLAITKITVEKKPINNVSMKYIVSSHSLTEINDTRGTVLGYNIGKKLVI